MSFRLRLLLGFALVSLLPLGALGIGIREVATQWLTDEYEGRVESLMSVIQDDFARTSDAISERLGALAAALSDDNRFRLAVAGGSESERPYLLDYAEDAMRLSGLEMLQIQDEEGRILTSGHFRQEFGRLEAGLPGLLSGRAGPALVRARSPDGPFITLVRSDSVRVGGRWFHLIGGTRADDAFLRRMAPDEHLTVSLELPGGRPSETVAPGAGSPPTEVVVESLSVPLIAPGNGGRLEVAEARIVVTQPTAALRALRRRVDVWFAATLGVTLFAVLWAALLLSNRISKPLTDLAAKTSRLDLDRLDVRFETGRHDEVGRLSTLLASMTERLRSSVERLRDAERRATVGELARQVNHDIKNGLTPIRNVVRHLASVGESQPGDLPDVFQERRATLESSIAYLEELAANYARLSPRLDARPCPVNAVVRQVVSTARAGTRRPVRVDLAPEQPLVMADQLVLRRILENLVGNALDALEDDSGTVTVSTGLVGSGGEGSPRVRITVSDTGIGMTSEEVQRAFEDFHTAKAGGTGLGLSVVRRLIMDLTGEIDVDSEPGRGTTFTLKLPAVEP